MLIRRCTLRLNAGHGMTKSSSMRWMGAFCSTTSTKIEQTTLPKERTPLGRQTEIGSDFGTATRTTPCTPTGAVEKNCFVIVGARRYLVFIGHRIRGLSRM